MDKTQLWPSIIIAIPPTIAALVTLYVARKGQKITHDKVDQLSINVDGRLTQLLNATKAVSLADGKAEGIESERNRKAD